MNKTEIEQKGAEFVALLKLNYPNQTDAEITAIMGYTSAFFLNTVWKHSIFALFGGVCYDILSGGAKVDEDQSVTEEASRIKAGD